MPNRPPGKRAFWLLGCMLCAPAAISACDGGLGQLGLPNTRNADLATLHVYGKLPGAIAM